MIRKGLLISLVLLLLVLVACGPAATPSAAPTTAPAAQVTPTKAAASTTAPAANVKLSDGKLVLAIINDQSGVYADLGGKNVVEAVKMAVEDYKAKYGENALGWPVEIISADHQY